MQSQTIIVATRFSKLAYNQTLQTVNLLKKHHPNIDFEIKKIQTKGDRITNKPLTEFWGTGIFIKEIEQALLNGEADMAVHSLKDVPAQLTDNLVFTSYPQREDVRDVFLTLHQSSTNKFFIGTGSPRRRLQMFHLYKNAIFKDIRGNIDTRIRKLKNKEYDAILLAAAGLNRSNIKYDRKQLLSIEQCLPAVGQGALVIQCRKDDEYIIRIARKINHMPTEKAVNAERYFLEFVQGGCKFPLAAHACINNKTLFFDALLGDIKTNKNVRKREVFSVDNPKKEIHTFVKNMLSICKKKGILINQ